MAATTGSKAPLIAEYPPQRVAWTKRDVLLFACSIGCSPTDQLHYLYEKHPNFQMFPTYPIVLTFKYDSSEVVDFLERNNSNNNNNAPSVPLPGPKLDWSRAVDGGRRIRIYRQLPTTSAALSPPPSWEVRSRVLGVYDKGPGKGTVMEREHAVVNAVTGEVFTKSWESAFFFRTGGWGGERGPRIQRFPAPVSRIEDVKESFQTTPQSAYIYRLNGDYNPLHASPDAGKSLGYDGIIIHGLFTWNVVAQVVLKHYHGGKPKSDVNSSKLLSFEARFASPIKPLDKLDISLWDMGLLSGSGVAEWNREQEEEGTRTEGFIREVQFVVRVGDRVVLSDGRALLEVTGMEQSKL